MFENISGYDPKVRWCLHSKNSDHKISIRPNADADADADPDGSDATAEVTQVLCH
jgi:hypothetical protein